MLHGCRPAGRLFCLVLALVGVLTFRANARGRVSADDAPKPTSSPAAKPVVGATPRAASPSPQSGPPLTSVIEVRENDYGWGQANDRNLIGRFNTQTFTLTRLAEVQDYFLRLYDSSSPPLYSRYSAALHVDYPL
jgi:hypothetical protein